MSQAPEAYSSMLPYLLRLIAHVIIATFKGPASLSSVFTTREYAGWFDVDNSLRLSQAGILRMFEYARAELLVRFGLLKTAFNGTGFVVASAQLSLSDHPLPRMYRPFSIRTMVTDVDDSGLYLIQQIEYGGKVAATFYVKIAVVGMNPETKRLGRIPIDPVLIKTANNHRPGSVAADGKFADDDLLDELKAHFDTVGALPPSHVTFHEHIEVLRKTEGQVNIDGLVRSRDRAATVAGVTQRVNAADQAVHVARFA
ncbi:Thioesterase-like superfamily [Carpediemonas membranifera]|uniref:Thioesterase-like superfamily n=1 Tax=Carpediemonas membranifera TaxID=201153 RepID=A0A8J6AZT6_9EUKA|nr:Thioesterase-like superfamily [Carpediemonas membranifera]|eukprot:KAG9392418.1 Thioesterase-like superfamily [Carpediemonas membranifera]